ncbi:MAG: crossover junction endodeoxyribonuclease RuvC [Gammaproteobacteria bacterium]|nr:crossover junction endodeoxyribonuclease RuvC [Gammaproteobacteria bacterium]MBU1628523.1 crossover junction endodeoxyribonuclease RuvC [Gammaproteobacteria bacterium]MBU1926957.1 crossover junction endodeoxyribonuclease RuvC [Gammaproteobacteria bacterium]MBU2545661.1 crossover junction endodeoxyribonuclease RuvC [Gammaproteobacteria bacterium]
MTIILGIDPGSCITGFGVIKTEGSRSSYVASGCIRMKAKETSQRLQQIHQGIREVVSRYIPDEVSIESIFMHQNPNSALKLGQARGVAMVAASMAGLSVFEYSARQVKQAVVGYGAADKLQVQHMVCAILNLSKSPQADAADALAIALCHANSRLTGTVLKEHLL